MSCNALEEDGFLMFRVADLEITRKEVVMQHRYQLGMAALLPLALNPGALTRHSSKQIATRIELYKIQTLTLSDQQFLKGAVTGKSAQPFYTDCLTTYVSDTD